MRWLALVLVVNTAAADTTTDPPAIDPATKLAGTVLAWNDSTFYLEARLDGPKLQLGLLKGARKDNVGYAMPLRVVGTSGDFVEVEPVASTDCGWTALGVPKDLERLRVFVKRTDLAPVVTKAFVKAYKDGTTLDVKPGLAVVPLASGAYRVAFESFTIDAPIPSASIGYAYAGFSGKRATTKAGDYLIESAKLTLGERTFDSDDTISVAAVDKRKSNSFVVLTVTCALARISVPNDAVSKGGIGHGYGIGGGGSGTGKYGERWLLAKGTALFAPGLKRQVAVAAKEIEVAKPDGKPEACFARNWTLDQPHLPTAPWTKAPTPRPTLMLCAPTSVVQHVNDAPNRP
jgi:hypothetical protein